MMDQLESDFCYMSENVVQRSRKGGKPALVIKEEKFHIKQLCPDIITVPIGVEAVWALLTPKNVNTNSKVKNIAVASIYYTKATKTFDFIDHISEAFTLLSAKFTKRRFSEYLCSLYQVVG